MSYNAVNFPQREYVLFEAWYPDRGNVVELIHWELGLIYYSNPERKNKQTNKQLEENTEITVMCHEGDDNKNIKKQ